MNARTLFQISARRLGLFLTLAATVAFATPVAPKPTDTAKVTSTLTPEGGRMVIDARGVPPPPPLFFSAAVDQTVQLTATEMSGEAKVKLHILQGKPEVLTIGLSGEGDVVEVTGRNLHDWSVRQDAGAAGGKRLLDLRPLLATGVDDPQDFDFVVRTRLKKPTIPGKVMVLLVTPGEAVGFSAKMILRQDAAVDLQIASVTGLVPLDESKGPREPLQFFATGEGHLEIKLAQRGGSLAAAELGGTQLTGKLVEAGGSVNFRLRGQLRAQNAGARLRLLQGRAALAEKTAGDGWHVDLTMIDGGGFGYDLVSDREGTLAVDLSFVAEVVEQGDWRTLDFTMPAGSVVPLQLEIRVAKQVRDVAFGARVEVVHAQHVMPCFDQPVAQVRAEETRAAGHQDLAHVGQSPFQVIQIGVACPRPRPAGTGAAWPFQAAALRQQARTRCRALQTHLSLARCRRGPLRHRRYWQRPAAGTRPAPAGTSCSRFGRWQTR